MDLYDALQTSSSGLSAQRLRMNLISANLANVNTTRTPEGGPYRRKEVVFEAKPNPAAFHDALKAHQGKAPADVQAVEDHRGHPPAAPEVRAAAPGRGLRGLRPHAERERDGGDGQHDLRHPQL